MNFDTKANKETAQFELFKEIVRATSKTEDEIFFKIAAEEQARAGDRFYTIIHQIADALELEQWTTDNIVQKVKEKCFQKN